MKSISRELCLCRADLHRLVCHSATPHTAVSFKRWDTSGNVLFALVELRNIWDISSLIITTYRRVGGRDGGGGGDRDEGEGRGVLVSDDHHT